MPKRSEHHRKLLRERKARQREKAEKALPASKEVLVGLFDYLDRPVAIDGYDHTLRLTLAWAAAEGLDGDRIVAWTREKGGFCDCEVLAIVEDSNPDNKRRD